MSFKKAVPVSALAALALAAASLPAVAQTGPGGPARQDLQRCVGGALSQLARSQTPETQVGKAVTSQCDKQLRASIEESVRTGEAGNCTVDSCLGIARERLSNEATASYRQSFVRR